MGLSTDEAGEKLGCFIKESGPGGEGAEMRELEVFYSNDKFDSSSIQRFFSEVDKKQAGAPDRRGRRDPAPPPDVYHSICKAPSHDLITCTHPDNVCYQIGETSGSTIRPGCNTLS